MRARSAASPRLRGKPSVDARLAARLLLERLPVEFGELRAPPAGAPAKHAAHARARSCPAATIVACPRRRAPRRSRRRCSAMPAAMSYSLTPCVDSGGDAVAGGDARQAVGDARHRDVARRRDRDRPGDRLERRRGGRPDEAARGEPPGARDRSSPAGRCAGSARAPSAQAIVSRPRSGDMRAADHAEHRLRAAQQRHRDRGAAPPLHEFEGAVVRIDQPGAARLACPALMPVSSPANAAGRMRLQRLAQPLLDLAVDFAMTASCPRGPAGRWNSSTQVLAPPPPRRPRPCLTCELTG